LLITHFHAAASLIHHAGWVANVHLRSSAPRLLFPEENALPRSTPDRPAQMAKLLGDLVDAIDGGADRDVSKRILGDATAMLLQPFFGVPEPDSIYGTPESSLEERLTAYKESMQERITRARKAGGETQAEALEMICDHVIENLPSDPLLRLRGGGSGSKPTLSADTVRKDLDSFLVQAERGLASVRKSIKPHTAPTTLDAAVAGAVCGFSCGRILIGDPTLLALVGASAFSYAHHYPSRANPRLLSISRRFAELAHEARGALSL
jgi:hypothetical protein